MPITVAGTAITFNDSTIQTSGGSRSLVLTGWQKMPGGLIEQWGITSFTAARFTGVAVTFPIAFPTACTSISVTPRVTVDESLGYLATSSYRFLTTTGFTGYGVMFNNTAGIDAISWYAIGY